MIGCLLVLAGTAWMLRRLGPAKDARDFFTAGGALPAWAVSLSFAASEASAMTVLGVPAAAFREDWRYLQFFAGSALARFLLAAWLLPRLQAAGWPTAYGWLERRFSEGTRRWGAAAFVAARIALSGVRLLAAAAALSALAGGPGWAWVLAVVAAATAASGWAGLRGAIFTGAAQAALLIAGGALLALWAAGSLDGGLWEVLRASEGGRKLVMLRLWPDGGFLRGILFDRSWLPAAFLGGLVGSAAAFAGDQEMLQGAMNASPGEGRRGLVWSAAAALLMLGAYLALGTALWAFYDQHTALALPESPDAILPHFAAQVGGRWGRNAVAALLFAAVVDLPLVAVSAVALADLGLRSRFSDEDWSLWPARAVAAAAALLIAAGTLLASSPGWSVHLARVGAAAYAPLLGLVAYGLAGPRRASRSAVPALGTATLLTLLLQALEARGAGLVGWHWAPLISAAAAAALAHFLDRDGASASVGPRAQ